MTSPTPLQTNSVSDNKKRRRRKAPPFLLFNGLEVVGEAGGADVIDIDAGAVATEGGSDGICVDAADSVQFNVAAVMAVPCADGLHAVLGEEIQVFISQCLGKGIVIIVLSVVFPDDRAMAEEEDMLLAGGCLKSLSLLEFLLQPLVLFLLMRLHLVLNAVGVEAYEYAVPLNKAEAHIAHKLIVTLKSFGLLVLDIVVAGSDEYGNGGVYL